MLFRSEEEQVCWQQAEKKENSARPSRGPLSTTENSSAKRTFPNAITKNPRSVSTKVERAFQKTNVSRASIIIAEVVVLPVVSASWFSLHRNKCDAVLFQPGRSVDCFSLSSFRFLDSLIKN